MIPSPSGPGFLISSGGVWVPGVYDTVTTARYAFRFSNAQLESLSHIWQIDGEGRPATMDDLRLLRARETA